LIACESGAEHAVQFLLSRKASCRLADKCGQRPIHHAAAGANVRIVRMLLLADVDSVSLLDSDGWTPLHHAAAVGFVECGECMRTHA
jgi:ankyrin repeat protein